MPSFGTDSNEQLSTCHNDLQKLFKKVVENFDCSILEGTRGKERQDELFRTGKSHLKYPNGKHNYTVSRAVDVAPYPIDWGDRDRFHFFAGYVKGIAESMNIKIIWGGDWDSDWQVRDNHFDDLPHFELVEVS